MFTRCFARLLQHVLQGLSQGFYSVFYKVFCKAVTTFLQGVLQGRYNIVTRCFAGSSQHCYKVFCTFSKAVTIFLRGVQSRCATAVKPCKSTCTDCAEAAHEAFVLRICKVFYADITTFLTRLLTRLLQGFYKAGLACFTRI